MLELVRGAYSRSHREALDRLSAHYVTTMEQVGMTPWPLNRARGAAYLAAKQKAVGKGQSRAKDYFPSLWSDLKSAARLQGRVDLSSEDERDMAQVCKVLGKGTPRTGQRQAKPFTVEALVAMAAAAPGQGEWGQEVLTVALVTWDLVQRGGAVVNMDWRHVTRRTDAHGPFFEVLFPWEKTARDRVCVLRPGDNPKICGYRALEAWSRARGAQLGPGPAVGAGAGAAAEGPRWVFPYIEPYTGATLADAPMTTEQYSSRLKRLAQAARLADAGAYSAHSGRRGGATWRLVSGQAVSMVMDEGGWASVSSFRRYDARGEVGLQAAKGAPRPTPAATSAAPVAEPRTIQRPLGALAVAAPFELGPSRGAAVEPAAGSTGRRAQTQGEEDSSGAGSESGPDPGSSASGGESDGSDAIVAAAKRQALEAWYEAAAVPEEWRGSRWGPTPPADKPRYRRLVRMQADAVREAKAKAKAARQGPSEQDRR